MLLGRWGIAIHEKPRTVRAIITDQEVDQLCDLMGEIDFIEIVSNHLATKGWLDKVEITELE